jgi:hypothetical protein
MRLSYTTIPCWEAINCTWLFPVGRRLTAHDYSLLGAIICTWLFPVGSDYLHMTIPCWEWLSAHDYSLLGAINCTRLFPVGRRLTAHDCSLLGSDYLHTTIPCWDAIICAWLFPVGMWLSALPLWRLYGTYTRPGSLAAKEEVKRELL